MPPVSRNIPPICEMSLARGLQTCLERFTDAFKRSLPDARLGTSERRFKRSVPNARLDSHSPLVQGGVALVYCQWQSVGCATS